MQGKRFGSCLCGDITQDNNVYKAKFYDLRMLLKPRLVIATGISGTGKSTTLDLVLKSVENSFLLEKDLIDQGGLYVAKDDSARLATFQDYLKNDSLSPEDICETQTPFGTMWRLLKKSEFFKRHIKYQTFITSGKLARKNLELGKVPVIDCFPIAYIKDYSLKRFVEHPEFKQYPVYLIHFTAEEEDLFKRHAERARKDRAAFERDKDKIGSIETPSRELFHRFITEQQPPIPPELQSYCHLLLDTSRKTPEECRDKCLEYISN